jgi:hypothetical protein
MQQRELENAADVSAIPNIKRNYEYVWNSDDLQGKNNEKTKKERKKKLNLLFDSGSYYFRKLPCYCKRCRHSSKRNCLNVETVGQWYSFVQKYIGKRVIQNRSIVQNNTTNPESEV